MNRALSPLSQAQAAAQRWTFPLRQKRWSGLWGNHSGLGSGNSLEFEDHRPYQPGDDLRHLNWNVFARTHSPTMKVFREEVAPCIDIACDFSASMALTPAKETLSRLLFLWASAAASLASSSVRLWQANHAPQPNPLQSPSLPSLSFQTQRPPLPASLLAIPWRRGSVRVLLSDLLWPGHPAPLLDTLARNAGLALILTPTAPEESCPPWLGTVELRDCESETTRLQRFDAPQLAAYQTAYQAHFDCWESEARRRHIPLARLPATLPFEEALASHALPAGAVTSRS